MKLIDLNPEWLGSGGEGVTETATGRPVPRREGVAIAFDCPCGCDQRIAIYVDPPMAGEGPLPGATKAWKRTGETFDSLTLTPSILRIGGCGWHGFITNGEAVTV